MSSRNARAPLMLRWLLRLYPRRYRDQFAADMAATFDDRRRDARSRGRRFVIALWCRTTADVTRAALAERWRSSLDVPAVGVERRGETASGAGFHLSRGLLGDLRYGARMLRRAPAYAAFAIVTLGLGIGATTAAFSVLDRVVLRPLPYPGAERIVVVGPARERNPERPAGVSAPLMEALQAAPGPAEAIVGISRGYAVLTGLNEPERVYPSQVTAGFFPFFGARPRVGRLLRDEDHAPGASAVAVLGHGFWMDRFGGDPAVLGRLVRLDGVPHTVIGVVSKDFVPPEQVMRPSGGDIWVPLPSRGSTSALGSLGERIPGASEYQSRIFTTWAVARLPDMGLQPDLEAHTARVLEAVYEAYGGYPRTIVGAAAQDLYSLTVGEVRSALWQVFAALGLLLIIACVNVASLQLTRASERAGELAVRSALGAGRLRLVRQLLCESVLLALTAGGLGAWIAFLAVEGFVRFSPTGSGGVPRLAEVMVDGRALAFSFSVAFVAVVAFGLLPALRATARLSSTARQATPGRAEARLRAGLVLGETALAVMLVAGAGLLVHDLIRRIQQDPGYRPEGVIAVEVSLPSERYGYGGARVVAFWRELLEGARALPGVKSAALASELPTTSFSFGRDLTPEGHSDEEIISMVRATSDFGHTIGIALSEGRWFSDAPSGDQVPAVVNQAFVDAYWPGIPSVVGRTIHSDRVTWRVVGVAVDAQVQPGVAPRPKMFEPLAEWPAQELVLRVDGEAAALAPALRTILARLDSELVDVDIRTLTALNAEALARPRFYTTLFSSFGFVAFLLALVGVYGTTAYAVRLRTREIGIRMALGARRGQVVSEVMARTVVVVAGGIAIGLFAAVLGSEVLNEMLVTLEPRNALTYAIVGALVFTAGAVATLLPAARASRIDPASTLRDNV